MLTPAPHDGDLERGESAAEAPAREMHTWCPAHLSAKVRRESGHGHGHGNGKAPKSHVLSLRHSYGPRGTRPGSADTPSELLEMPPFVHLSQYFCRPRSTVYPTLLNAATTASC